MCGICGILDWGRADPAVRHQRVDRMVAALTHRGPDDQGSWHGRELALGFRRLAVIDLETGNQPIALEDDRAVIVLNGEIYNFRELRREQLADQSFRTHGDVEVVLRLYARHGIDAIRRLDGMFALAIWDAVRRTLVLARDRFGVKPLFFSRDGETLVFGSELRTLLAGGYPRDARLDPLQLRQFLAQRYPDPHHAPLEGVRAVPPGAVVEISAAGERWSRFWDPPPAEASPGMSDDESLARLEQLLRAAVHRQLVADVPVGLFLSGGVDSGTVAAMLADRSAGPVKTFSVGFGGAEGEVADERPRAAAAARHLKTEHHELAVEPQQVARDLPAILAALDGPLADPTVVPTWYLSALARRTVVVALSGEGADELFGGYDRVRFDLWIDRIGPLGRRMVPRVMAMAGRHPSERFRDRLTMPAGLERQLDWSRTFTADEIDALSVEPLADEDTVREAQRERADEWERRALDDPINARLAVDRELFLPGDLLPKVDRMSMAHSLEVRVPFLDNELADFALAQPGSRKIRGATVKWMLRRVAQDLLPAGASRLPKTGFDVPVSAWLRGPLREPMCDLLSPAAVGRRGLFRPARVEQMIEEHIRGVRDHGIRLWTLLSLEGWMCGALDDRAGVSS
jgi:asparagine synthase (glutamine-hydrolysing)